MIHHILRRLKSPASVLAFMFFALTSFSGTATAATYTVYIHGLSPGGASFTQGTNYHDYGYWPTIDSVAIGGFNQRAINWNGTGRIADTNATIRAGLDCYCTGENNCHVVAHSAGNLQIGYALSLYGSTTRDMYTPPAYNGGAAASTCTKNYDTASLINQIFGFPPPPVANYRQTGWNIKSVTVAAGAAGGSELASKFTALFVSLNQDLIVANARSLYNHNTTQGHQFNLYIGAKSQIAPEWTLAIGVITNAVVAALLPGQDDGAVAYHSSAGRSSSGKYCNPGDFGARCKTVSLGIATAGWSNHNVANVDTGANYTHTTVKKLAYEAGANFR